MSKKGRISAAIFAAVLTVVMLASSLATVPAKAGTANWKDPVSDPSSMGNWAYTFGSSATDLPENSENIGRIWTDKSVFTGNAQIPKYDNITVNKTDGADFLIGLSALSSASSEFTTTSQPLDIVLVLDVSGSMQYGFYEETYDVNTSGSYYVYDTGVWYPVSYHESDVVVSFIPYKKIPKGWSYNKEGNTYVPAPPKTSATDTDSSHVQFYVQTSTIKKITALQNAVNDFLKKRMK